MMGKIVFPLFLLTVSAFFLLGFEQLPDAPQADAPTAPVPATENAPAEKTAPASIFRDITIQPRESELSEGARETYAYLLFIQALLDDDEAALLDVVPNLEKSHVPMNVWLDGGIWLISRKSPNAVPFLEQALKAYPDDLSLNLLYSEALGDHGMPGQGVDVMRQYLQKHPDSIDARLELALLLVKDRQFDSAGKILAEISQKQRTPLVDFYQGKALLGMGKRAQAIPYLKKAVKGLPDFVEGMAELAFAYEEEGNFREARSTYEKLLKLNFSPADVALRLVNLSLKLKQPDRAVQYIRQGPASMPFRLTAANMLLEARYYLQAENILKNIAAKDGAPYEVFLLLADLVYDQRHNLDMAFSWLDKIPRDSPGYSKALMLRMQLYAEAGKTGAAIKTADEAIKLFPDSQDIWDMKIRLLAREKKMDDALAVAGEAIKNWPDSTPLHFLYGSLLDDRGKKSEALAVMEDILKKQPDNFQALNYVGFTLAEENRDLERALELLRKADELSPNQAYIVDSLAWALFRAGQGEEALRQIRRAVTLGETPDPAIWEHYGDIAKQQGLKNEARKAYRKAIELKPSNGNELRKRLSTL